MTKIKIITANRKAPQLNLNFKSHNYTLWLDPAPRLRPAHVQLVAVK